MNKSSEIRRLLKSFGKSEVFQSLFFAAEVVSAKDEKCSVKVGTTTLSDVRTGAVIDGNANNLRIKPTVGSMVLVADLSGGGMSDLAVIGFSEVDTIMINGGAFGGLVKIQELTDKLNELVTKFNNHTHSGVVTAVAGQATGTIGTSGAPVSTASDFEKSYYEDEKIKH